MPKRPRPLVAVKKILRKAPAPLGTAGQRTAEVEALGEVARSVGSDRSRQRSPVLELTWVRFDSLIQELSRRVRTFKPEAVVGVAHGGVFVGGALAGALRVEFFPVRITRRSRDAVKRKSPRLLGEMPEELEGLRVLIVDDVAASGDTLEVAKMLATQRGAKAVLTACLVARDEGYRPDHFAIETDELVVFPWDYQTVAEDGRFDTELDPGKAGT